ncbi:MAG: nucleotidyltransferase family protein [Anaerolineae bacterium]
MAPGAARACSRWIWICGERRAERVQVAGQPVLRFSPEDMVLHLALHMRKHRYVGLRWLCDVAELLRRFDGPDAPRPLDWQYIAGGARAAGLTVLLYIGLHVGAAAAGRPGRQRPCWLSAGAGRLAPQPAAVGAVAGCAAGPAGARGRRLDPAGAAGDPADRPAGRHGGASWAIVCCRRPEAVLGAAGSGHGSPPASGLPGPPPPGPRRNPGRVGARPTRSRVLRKAGPKRCGQSSRLPAYSPPSLLASLPTCLLVYLSTCLPIPNPQSPIPNPHVNRPRPCTHLPGRRRHRPAGLL